MYFQDDAATKFLLTPPATKQTNSKVAKDQLIVAYTKGEVGEVDASLKDTSLPFTFTTGKVNVWFSETDTIMQGKVMTLTDVLKKTSCKKFYNHDLLPADVIKPRSHSCCFVPKEDFFDMG